MKISTNHKSLENLSADLLILPICENHDSKKADKWASKFGKSVEHAAEDFKGEKASTVLCYPTEGKAKRLLLLGLGKYESLNTESLRQSVASAVAAIRQTEAVDIALALPALDISAHDTAKAFVEGLKMALYQYNVYKTDPKAAAKAVESLTIWTKEAAKHVKNGADEGAIVADAVCLARDLVNTSPNDKSPTALANLAKDVLEKFDVDVEIWDKEKITEEKMGGLLAVNMGSKEPPTFTIMEWKPKAAVNANPIVLVGKGVVYDTGGLSLKPTLNSMDHMKCDMAGAAAVIATMRALAQSNVPLHVVGLVPATDNRPGENAYVPGDVITMHNGMTVEVLNTDAEGRLILADALSIAKAYNPELVVDLATLTGAQVVALGNFVAAVMTNEDENAATRLADFHAAGRASGDWVAPLPLLPEYAELLKSTVADMKNIGGPMAGTITAGKFLEKFTDYPWVHVDIAGPAFISAARHYQPAGGTGFGVKLLIELLTRRVA
jgi:leucyl aminopeptidase